METPSEKYPRTMHLPWSSGTKDDRIASSVQPLLNTELVITEKLDGSNLCFERSAIYARSHSGPPQHPSFGMAKSIHAATSQYIIPGLQYFGEYCYAVHSIKYPVLPAYLFIFSVRKNYPGSVGKWMSWDQTLSMIGLLNLTAYGSVYSNKIAAAPVLWTGKVKTESELQKLTESLGKDTSIFGGTREGVVVRKTCEYSDTDFETSVMKWVRKDHVQTDIHWAHKEVEKQNITGGGVT